MIIRRSSVACFISDLSLDRRRENAGEGAVLAAKAGMLPLVRIMNSCIDESVAEGTLRIYKRVKKNFISFAKNFAVPASALPKLRNLFLAHLIDTGKMKSIPYHMAALSHFFGSLPAVDKEIQQALLNSTSKRLTPVRQRKKATPRDVHIVLKWALRRNDREAIQGATMILLSFLALLRISELCSVCYSHLEHKEHDLWWLHIPRSKTDQSSKGATVAFRVRGIAALLWEKFFGMVGPFSEQQFIFQLRKGGQMKRDYASRLIKKTLVSAGLGHKNLTSHAFRGGAATTAIRSGANPQNVMRAGRWKSIQAFSCYVEPTPL